MAFSPGVDFYAAAAQVIPLLLLALVFEARLVTRIRDAFQSPPNPYKEEMIQTYLETEHLKHPELTPEELAAIGTSMRSLRIPRRLVPLLLLGLVAAVAAEVVALVALTLSDPSDALAVIVLVGCGALLFALLVGIGDAVVREFRAKPPELSKTPPGGPD